MPVLTTAVADDNHYERADDVESLNIMDKLRYSRSHEVSDVAETFAEDKYRFLYCLAHLVRDVAKAFFYSSVFIAFINAF
jgi:hypothetical protein